MLNFYVKDFCTQQFASTIIMISCFLDDKSSYTTRRSSQSQRSEPEEEEGDDDDDEDDDVEEKTENEKAEAEPQVEKAEETPEITPRRSGRASRQTTAYQYQNTDAEDERSEVETPKPAATERGFRRVTRNKSSVAEDDREKSKDEEEDEEDEPLGNR